MVVCKFKVLDIYRLGSIKYFSCTFKTSNHTTFKSVYTKCILNFLMCTKRKSLPKNNLLLQKLFNHSPSTISTKFAFHFWRKCLFACLKIVFFFARWGCNSNHHCSLWLSIFFLSLQDLCSRWITQFLLAMPILLIRPSLFSSGVLVCCTLKGGWAYLEDLSILCQKRR